MAEVLKTGSRWKSAVCDTEVMVVRAPSEAVALQCGGASMLALAAPRPEGAPVAPDHSGGTQLGKRYADEDLGLEVLCTKAGAGSLSIGQRALEVKQAKKLPSSD